MVTVLEYALLSKHVYQPESNLFGRTAPHFQIKKNTLLNTNNDHGWYQIVDMTPSNNPSNDFYAQLYIKLHHGKTVSAVIAYRGTEPTMWGNDKEDFDVWVSNIVGNGSSDEVPSYYKPAKSFYLEALDYVSNKLNCTDLSVTGHSLGGALAQLIPALGLYSTNAITFNSPGIGNIPGVTAEEGNHIFGFNSRYGFINKIGKPVGEVTYLDVPNDEDIAKFALDSYTEMKGVLDEITHSQSDTQKALLYYYAAPENIILDAVLVKAMIAQHSIGHTIKTLKEKQYVSIANESFA